jgi:dephospho-CoA kinase
MGKTETAKLFARLGIPVYHADEAVHALYGQGGAAVPKIAKAFPGSVKRGAVDRRALKRILAGRDAAFKRLEKIVHPLVARARQNFLTKARKAKAEFVVLDIPLLFETGGEKSVDAVVVVSAPLAVQRERVLSRSGMTVKTWETLLSRQMPDAEKRAKADFVIETDKGLDHAFASVKRVVTTLRRQAQRQKA